MSYSKKISYLDYCENGERICGVGFVKTELRNDELTIYVNVRGLRQPEPSSPKVVLYCSSGEKLLGQIQLENGQGEMRHTCHLLNDAKEENGNVRLLSLRIVLGEGREIRCIWENDSEKALKVQECEGITERIEDEGLAKRIEDESITERIEDEGTTERIVDENSDEIKECECSTEVKENEEPQTVVRLLEDKWRQISAIYPHVQPFQDDRDFLSITPADFVMLTADSYRGANNSFLLHGFYNYRHLILTRLEQRGEILYYLGVPGNYYDREKQVAILFGFESFECAEEPAQEGDYGYYMMRVQI